MIFEAKDIEVNSSPILRLALFPKGDEEVSLTCVNEGWGDAHNITISLYGEGLDEFIPKEKQSIFIPEVKAIESKSITIWNANDLLQENATGKLNLTATCVDNEGNEIETECFHMFIIIDEGKFTTAFGEGPSDDIYGVKIDTSESTYQYEYNISESIKGKERLELPICFFPDKSCTLKFRVTFEVVYNDKNDKTTISTDWAEIKFRLSSIYNYGLNDVRDYSNEQLTNMIHEYPGIVKVTYPAVELKELENAGTSY